jgi:hypothetical protein
VNEYTATNGVVIVEKQREDEFRAFIIGGNDGVLFTDREYDALREFFRAETNPAWHDAKAGEIWSLTVEGTEQRYVAITSHGNRGFYIRMFPVDDPRTVTVGADAPAITAGHRIYPEGD